MALLIFNDGRKVYTDYNTAAKIWQILNGNELSVNISERPKLTKIAEQTESIDFTKLEFKNKFSQPLETKGDKDAKQQASHD